VKYRHDYFYRHDPGLVLAETKLDMVQMSEPEAREFAREICGTLAIGEPELDFRRQRRGAVYFPNPGDSPVIVLPLPVTRGTLLHELAHHLHWCLALVEGRADAYWSEGHGPIFCSCFRLVLEVAGHEVPRFAPYEVPRFSRKRVAEEVAKRLCCPLEEVEVRRVVRRDKTRFVYLATPGGGVWAAVALVREPRSPYFEWKFCRMWIS